MQELSLNNCRLDKRYDIREQLGRGSYAEIYLARDILASEGATHQQVVVKALNVFLQNDLDADLERTLVENFQNEAIALDRVRHPNIISRVGHGTARDLRGMVFHYLVLEYLEGGDLQNLLRRRTISLEQTLGYMEQICAGLGHAHSRGIIHRDIKPQNLLLTSDLSTVKIADFGVARVNISDSPITRVGTNIYAPPEHSPMSAGQTGTLVINRLTPAADIYSLAKCFYTVLTGDAPRQFANKQITDVPDSIRGKEWEGEFFSALKKATSDDPRERQQTVEEFWRDLAVIGRMAGDRDTLAEKETGAVPRPHISRGYSPIVPAVPRFAAMVGVPNEFPPEPLHNRINVTTDHSANGMQIATSIRPPARQTRPVRVPGRRVKRVFRRLAAFAIFVGLFTGILYGTASYMRGRGILPDLISRFSSRTATANTDIYLRPQPNTDNDPIGLVTKNSKVRIVNTRDNWYQVDVIEQGRVRTSQVNASSGWLNGKYLDQGQD